MKRSSLPSATDAEQAVLGGLLLEPSSMAKISGWLIEEDFYERSHRLIFRAITKLSLSGTPPDAVTLGDWLEGQGVAALVGGIGYVVEIANATPSAANIVAYAEIVKEKANLRRAAEVGSQLVTAAQGGGKSGDVIAVGMQQLANLKGARLKSDLQEVKALFGPWLADLQRRYELGDAVTGLPTPWEGINDATHGLQSGELTVIAARPNMGKSVMGVQLAVFLALMGRRTLLFSLEMTNQQVMRRAISCSGQIPHEWLLAPRGQDEWWPNMTNASAALIDAPLLIDDSPGLSIEQITARAQRAHLQRPVELLVVDHLHEMQVNGDRASHDIGRNIQGLKALGKEFGCPVVVLAQLNRGMAGRSDKRPTMTDLRASGEIEQKADVILFLHREDYYEHDTHLQEVVEVEIGKGRDIRSGTRIHLHNRYDQMRLDNWKGAIPAEPIKAPSSSRGFNYQR
jgi:replicative DNA helicase